MFRREFVVQLAGIWGGLSFQGVPTECQLWPRIEAASGEPPLTLQLGREIVIRLRMFNSEDDWLCQTLADTREQLGEQGINMPVVRLRSDYTIGDYEYAVRVYGIELIRETAIPEYPYYIYDNPDAIAEQYARFCDRIRQVCFQYQTLFAGLENRPNVGGKCSKEFQSSGSSESASSTCLKV